MVRQLRQGSGWRLGWNPDAAVYKGLIGGENWAIELTEIELDDLCRLVTQLAHILSQMTQELMDEEAICCEAESDLLWVEAEGYPHAYRLRFILLTGRCGEGYWSAEAVPELLQAIQLLKVF